MGNRSAEETAKRTTIMEDDRLSLNERLALIGLIEEGARSGSSDSPIVADLFSDLWALVDRTVSGSSIDRLKPEHSTNGFQVIEINAESGENLGRLHMLYLKKPLPCYYLVYVEVAPPFRNKGLGNRIVVAFRRFLEEKNALGILDNIIEPDDPTFDIYAKQRWLPLDEIAGIDGQDAEGVYMIYVPKAMQGRDLGDPIRRVIHHLQRKRASIEMRENELMVRRTIDEFKELYSALLTYFDEEIQSGEPSRLMRFMFTRFVTKLLGFRRRIGQLIGYTGGESLEQIALSPAVSSLPVQSYSPLEQATGHSFVRGDRELWLQLSEDLKTRPARTIEALPNYRRPSLVTWMNRKNLSPEDPLTIGELMELGFDPTRLKEISIHGEDFIFERVQARMIPELEEEAATLEALSKEIMGARVRNASLKVNPVLVMVRDRGNAYVLRRKVQGIHWEEAVDQLQSVDSLKGLNASTRIDKIVVTTIRKTKEKLAKMLQDGNNFPPERFSYFVAWDLERNQPKLTVDMAGSFLESVWVA